MGPGRPRRERGGGKRRGDASAALRAVRRAAVIAAALAAALARPDVSFPISDVCEDSCFRREDLGLFDCRTEIRESCSVIIPQGMEFVINRARKSFVPPVATDVEAAPDADGASVIFTVGLMRRKGKDEPADVEVRLYYSVNERATWRAERMEYDPFSEKWHKKITLEDAGRTVRYFVQAKDTDGNSYVEIPCEAESFPPVESDCLVPLSIDQSYEDYAGFEVEPHFDVLRSRVGMSGDDLYVTIEANGDIDPGRVSPTRISYYFAAVMNPDGWNRYEPYQNTAILIYAPMKFLPADCALFRRFAGEWLFDTSSLRCAAGGRTIHMSAPAKLVPGKNPSGWFVTVIGTGQLIGENSGIVKDYTMLTAVRAVERMFPPGGGAQ
ncbi:MAG: hypothetical protein AB1742_11135 [bacterium]